ncbi:arad-like aldolase/epimerase [Trichocladium antarcticum]|uniref:Arad-like aldolase/epimerase n=1 Tax=Trichocladium antarcticum TaxID=1450529 RepID=A0AAN6UBR4_9PEZI|nr:arad-like aldolase/epimerase [Trichocladium antarcticum]
MEHVTQMQQHYRKFIDACHILHHQQVLDTDGHISFRHPRRDDVFIMPRDMAAGAVSSEADLVEYSTTGALPLDPTSPAGHAERFIHAEIYKQYTHVHAIVHSHSPAVIPYTISRVRLKPCSPTAGFLRACGPPVFDAATYATANLAGDSPPADLLVRDEYLGRKLAYRFSQGDVVALMRAHGFTAVAESTEQAVFRAVCTHRNAEVLTTALAVQAAAQRAGSFPQAATPGIHYLSEEEVAAAAAGEAAAVRRAWEMWVREVRAAAVYVNSA